MLNLSMIKVIYFYLQDLLPYIFGVKSFNFYVLMNRKLSKIPMWETICNCFEEVLIFTQVWKPKQYNY